MFVPLRRNIKTKCDSLMTSSLLDDILIPGFHHWHTSNSKSGNEVSVTCLARRRLLTNTLLNLMSLRYLPTASPCRTPVSDRSVSTPCPERHIWTRRYSCQQGKRQKTRAERGRTLQQLVFVVRRLPTAWKKQNKQNWYDTLRSALRSARTGSKHDIIFHLLPHKSQTEGKHVAEPVGLHSTQRLVLVCGTASCFRRSREVKYDALRHVVTPKCTQ